MATHRVSEEEKAGEWVFMPTSQPTPAESVSDVPMATSPSQGKAPLHEAQAGGEHVMNADQSQLGECMSLRPTFSISDPPVSQR